MVVVVICSGMEAKEEEMMVVEICYGAMKVGDDDG